MSTKITADNITEAQLRELLESARGVDFDVYRIAMTAIEDTARYREILDAARKLAARVLSNWSMPVDIAQAKTLSRAVLGLETEARARCAEILEAQRKEAK